MTRLGKVVLLSCLVLLVSASTASAASYSVTQEELSELQTIFNRLQTLTEAQQKTLTELKQTSQQDKKRLLELQGKLAQSEQDLEKLQNHLKAALERLIQAKSDLEKANASLSEANKLLKESSNEVRALKFQRFMLAGGVLYYMLKDEKR